MNKTKIYFIFWMHLTHLAQAQQSQSDLVSIHVQIISITDSAAFVRCDRMFKRFDTKRKAPSQPLDCRILFETSAVDSVWIPLEWAAFDHEHYSSPSTKLQDIDTEKNGTNLKGFIDTIKRSLVILENAEGEFRILYGKRGQYDRRLNRYEGAVYGGGIHDQPSLGDGPLFGPFPPLNEYGDWITLLPIPKTSFYKGKTYQVNSLNKLHWSCGYPSVLFSFDDLRVKKGDTSCRMHYVYVSSTSNPKLERIRRVYTSNWFPLNEE